MNLEQLISKESVLSVISDFTVSSNRHLCIKDSEGNVLLGSNGHDSDGKYPILMNSKAIGFVVGGKKASAAASFLTYLAAEESEIPNISDFQVAMALERTNLYNDFIKSSFITIIDALVETLDKRDPYTAGHTRRVKNYCMFLGRELGLSEPEMQRLHLAAILHDIGKIGVKDHILCKTGKLTEEEYGEMKMHTIYGWEILRHIKLLEDILPGVRHHHERYDGNGYPDRLIAEEIDIIARIIAVTDAFDAMTFDRPYKYAMTIPEAFEELKKNSGAQFDPAIVNVFMKTYENGSFSHKEIMLCFKRSWNFSFSELT